MQNDPFFLSFGDLFVGCRHFGTVFKTDQMYLTGSETKCGQGDVHHLLAGDRVDVLLKGFLFLNSGGMLAQHFSRCRTGHIHGDIAAADHNHFLADGELIAKIDVE